MQTGYSGTVTVALASGPAGAALGGTTTVQVEQRRRHVLRPDARPGRVRATRCEATSSGLPPVTTGDVRRGPGGGQPARDHDAAPVERDRRPDVRPGRRPSRTATATSRPATAASVSVALGGQPGRCEARRHHDGRRQPGRRHLRRPDARPGRQRLHAPGHRLGPDLRHHRRRSTWSPARAARSSRNTPSQIVITDGAVGHDARSTAGSTFTVAVALENSQGQVQTGYSGHGRPSPWRPARPAPRSAAR